MIGRKIIVSKFIRVIPCYYSINNNNWYDGDEQLINTQFICKVYLNSKNKDTTIIEFGYGDNWMTVKGSYDEIKTLILGD